MYIYIFTCALYQSSSGNTLSCKYIYTYSSSICPYTTSTRIYIYYIYMWGYSLNYLDTGCDNQVLKTVQEFNYCTYRSPGRYVSQPLTRPPKDGPTGTVQTIPAEVYQGEIGLGPYCSGMIKSIMEYCSFRPCMASEKATNTAKWCVAHMLQDQGPPRGRHRCASY